MDHDAGGSSDGQVLKWPENVPGEFYVDNRCIRCGICWELAPKNFVSHELHAYAFVAAQPASAEERSRCLEAKKICPVEAIGTEG